jgi:hypothetical protein
LVGFDFPGAAALFPEEVGDGVGVSAAAEVEDGAGAELVVDDFCVAADVVAATSCGGTTSGVGRPPSVGDADGGAVGVVVMPCG